MERLVSAVLRLWWQAITTTVPSKFAPVLNLNAAYPPSDDETARTRGSTHGIGRRGCGGTEQDRPIALKLGRESHRR